MIPDDIKQKIKAVAEKQRSPFAYTVIAEFGYSLAQQEIERLKGLLESQIKRHYWYADIQEIRWQQFKKDNQL